jgi:hypothetical protein
VACVCDVKEMIFSFDATITETKYRGKKLIYSQLRGMRFRIQLEFMYVRFLSLCLLLNFSAADQTLNHTRSTMCVGLCVCLCVCVCVVECEYFIRQTQECHSTRIMIR